MPEGPETKRMADDISRTVKQKEISSLKFLHPSLKSLNSKMELWLMMLHRPESPL